MTREKARELLPILQAFSEGKAIQMITPSGWEDVKEWIAFDCIPEAYRIKPEPRRFWLVCRKDSPRLTWGVWTAEPAEKDVYDIVPVIEVLK